MKGRLANGVIGRIRQNLIQNPYIKLGSCRKASDLDQLDKPDPESIFRLRNMRKTTTYLSRLIEHPFGNSVKVSADGFAYGR